MVGGAREAYAGGSAIGLESLAGGGTLVIRGVGIGVGVGHGIAAGKLLDLADVTLVELIASSNGGEGEDGEKSGDTHFQ
jgi:hypothetical protein